MTRHTFNLNLLSVGAFKLNWGVAHRTIAILMAPIGLREHLRTRPTQSSPEHEQLHSPELELGRRQTGRRQQEQEEDDGRPCLWASCRHVCLIKATRRCRLPCLLSAIAGADVACACAWPHGRGSCCVPSGSCSWAHALVHKEKQTNRQTRRPNSNKLNLQ